jgi:hypothetical protein
VEILNFWLGKVIEDFKLNLLVQKNLEVDWGMKNPHYWKCKSSNYGQLSNYYIFEKFDQAIVLHDAKNSRDRRHQYEIG